MASKSSQMRNRWKEEDPAKYQQYLDKQRERARERRAAKKEKWDSEPHTRAMIAEREKEREQGRNRMKRLSERRPSEGRRVLHRTSDEGCCGPSSAKKPKDMTEEERRAHAAELKRRSRARQNPRKKRWAKVKNAEYQRRYRERTKSTDPSQPPFSLIFPVPSTQATSQTPSASTLPRISSSDHKGVPL